MQTKYNCHILHRWLFCCYYILYVPFKPVIGKDYICALKSSKLQKVRKIEVYFSFEK